MNALCYLALQNIQLWPPPPLTTLKPTTDRRAHRKLTGQSPKQSQIPAHSGPRPNLEVASHPKNWLDASHWP